MIKKRHNRDQLSQCHMPCEGPLEPNPFPFAPGVIDVGPETDTKGDWIADLVAAMIAVGAVAAVVGFATGYLNLPGWLL